MGVVVVMGGVGGGSAGGGRRREGCGEVFLAAIILYFRAGYILQLVTIQ